MNILRAVYPLWLREKIYHRTVAHLNHLPDRSDGFPLEFVPYQMHALLPTDLCHRQIAWLGYWELSLTRQILRLAREGGLMVDVGANAGYFSCIYAAANPHNEIYAFEASPRNCGMLQQNLSKLTNRERVSIFEFALGKDTATCAFDPGPAEQTGWGGFSNTITQCTTQVNVVRLDDVIPDRKAISVLKIDTEGADTWVLFGAEKLLRQKRIKHIFFELNPGRMDALGIKENEAVDFLTDFGFQIERQGVDTIHAWVE